MRNSESDDAILADSEPTPDASSKPDVPLKTDDPTIKETASIPNDAPIPDVTAKPDVPTKPVTLHKAVKQSNPEGIGQSEMEGCSAGKEDDQLLKSDKVRKTKKVTKSRSSSPARMDMARQVQTKLIRDYFKQQELKRKRQFSPEEVRAPPTQDTASVSSVATSGNVTDIRMQDFSDDEVT